MLFEEVQCCVVIVSERYVFSRSARLDLQCSVGYGIVSVSKWCRYSSRILWKILFQDMLSNHQQQKIYFNE